MSRVQLSLYVPEPVAAMLEAARRVLDPVQLGLIPAHVTLCREDELGDAKHRSLAEAFALPAARAVTLRFGLPEAFQGHGILLSCVEGEDDFRALREHVLGRRPVRRQAPHITLAHPRNVRAPGNSLSNALAAVPAGLVVEFDRAFLIRQQAGTAWEVDHAWGLAVSPRRILSSMQAQPFSATVPAGHEELAVELPLDPGMSTAADPFDLSRFVEAQAKNYAEALAELQAGHKRTHWSWYVLPQIRGLGSSPMSVRYAISGLEEARAYLAHPLLGARLRETVAALAAHRGVEAARILGPVDAQKLRSCLTLFGQASREPLFRDALAQFFEDSEDAATLAILERQPRGDANTSC